MLTKRQKHFGIVAGNVWAWKGQNDFGIILYSYWMIYVDELNNFTHAALNKSNKCVENLFLLWNMHKIKY